MRAPDRVQNDLKKGLTEGVSTYVSRWKGPKGRRKIVGHKVAWPDRLTADRPLEGRGAGLLRHGGVSGDAVDDEPPRIPIPATLPDP